MISFKLKLSLTDSILVLTQQKKLLLQQSNTTTREKQHNQQTQANLETHNEINKPKHLINAEWHGASLSSLLELAMWVWVG